MRKRITVLFVLFYAIGLGLAQTPEEQQTVINWKEVQVVYDLNEVAGMRTCRQLPAPAPSSLNFVKSRRMNECLIKLKKQAAQKGYKVIYVDEEKSKFKRFDKRGVKVTLVGVGYKG